MGALIHRYRHDMRAGSLSVLVAALAFVACTTDDPDPEPEGAAETVVTQIRTGTTVTWGAAGGPSADDLAVLRDEFGGEVAALLVPGDGSWPEAAVVEIRVDRFVPDPGFLAASAILRSNESGGVVTSVQRSEVAPLDCTRRTDGAFEAVDVRATDGCALAQGGVTHVIWNEGGFRWTAESSTHQDPAALIEHLDRWRLLTQDDH